MLSEIFSTLKQWGRSTPPAQECQHENTQTKPGLTSRRATCFWGQTPLNGDLSPLVQGGEAGALGAGERAREPLDAACAKGAGALRWVETLPRCVPGCVLLLPTCLPTPAQEPSAASQADCGCRVPEPRACARCSVIRTFLWASLHSCLRLIPLFGIN